MSSNVQRGSSGNSVEGLGTLVHEAADERLIPRAVRTGDEDLCAQRLPNGEEHFGRWHPGRAQLLDVRADGVADLLAPNRATRSRALEKRCNVLRAAVTATLFR